MKKSNSYSYELNEYEGPPLRKSKSNETLSDNKFIFGDFFEGDGPLGIVFKENKNEIIINNITKNTVAGEMYGLELNMILLSINNTSIQDNSFRKVMQKIRTIWKKERIIYLRFKKNINHTIYQSLDSIGYLSYYDNFMELGVKELIDYDFIKYSDLVSMEIPKDKIQDFHKLNKKINPEIYDFCKEMNCKKYFEKIINIGLERVIDFELLEYNDLIDISMDDETIQRFAKKFKGIRKTKAIKLYLTPGLSDEEKMREINKFHGKLLIIY